MIVKPTVTTPNALLPYVPGPGAQTAGASFSMTAYPLQFHLIEGATAQSNEKYEMQVLGRNLHAIQVKGITTATVLVEATVDGENWVTLSSVTADGITQYSGLYASIRVSISAYTSGSIDVFGISQRT